jgi:hypothetical protein
VGAHLTFSGEHWSGTQVSLTAATTSCDTPASGLGQATIPASGSFTTTIIWPTSLDSSGAVYLLCATSDSSDSATAAQSYRVRSDTPPALSVSLTDAGVGQEVQISGANFIGASNVTLEIETPRGQRTLATLVPDPKDGSFVQSYVPSSGDMGAVTLTATSAPDGSAPPELQASAALTIGPAPIPSPTVAPTPVPTSGPVIVSRESSSSAGAGALAQVVLLVVGGFLALLALIGVAAWLALRPRNDGLHRRKSGEYGGYPAPASRDMPTRRAPAAFREAPQRQTAHMPARMPARAPVGAGAPRSGERGRIGRLWQDAPEEPDKPDKTSEPTSARRPRTMGDLVRSQRDRGYANGDGDGYRDDYGTGYGDDDPTAPGDRRYYGLPPLDSRDAVAHRNGSAPSNTHE